MPGCNCDRWCSFAIRIDHRGITGACTAQFQVFGDGDRFIVFTCGDIDNIAGRCGRDGILDGFIRASSYGTSVRSIIRT